MQTNYEPPMSNSPEIGLNENEEDNEDSALSETRFRYLQSKLTGNRNHGNIEYRRIPT